MDATSIASFATGLKAAGDIAKSLLSLKVTGEVQAKVIELQTILMSAQSDALSAQQSQFEMLTKVRALEEEIARLKSMGAERERYQLEQVDSGAFAYVLKPEAQAGEQAHWLCVNCFDAGHKSVLQNQGRTKDNAHSVYGCPRCKGGMTVHWRSRPKMQNEEAPPPPSGGASTRIVRG